MLTSVQKREEERKGQKCPKNSGELESGDVFVDFLLGLAGRDCSAFSSDELERVVPPCG